MNIVKKIIATINNSIYPFYWEKPKKYIFIWVYSMIMNPKNIKERIFKNSDYFVDNSQQRWYYIYKDKHKGYVRPKSNLSVIVYFYPLLRYNIG